MGIYKGTTYLGAIYKNNEYIGEVYKGNEHIASMGFLKTVSGQAPLSLPNARAKATSWKIDGQSKQGVLPDGYTQLEYLENTGTCWIDAGIKATNNSKVEIGVMFNNSGTEQCAIGSRDANSSRCQYIHIYSGRFCAAIYYTFDSSGDDATANTKYDLTSVVDGMTMNVYNGSTLVSTVTGTSGSLPDSNITLFRRSMSDSPTSLNGKIYYCRIYISDVLTRNFIPAKNSSNVLGMYDTVTNTFFTNAGTGTFTAGAELTPSPTNPLEIKAVGDSGLPSGYKKLQYIQGDSHSYIDTGLIPIRGDSFKFNVSCSPSPDMGNRYAIFDSGGSGSAYKTCILMGTSSEISGGEAAYYKYFATGGAATISSPLTTPTNVEITSTGIIKYNGVQVAESAPTGDVTTNVFLWRHMSSGTCSNAKFTGNFEWRDSSGALRMDLVSAKNSSNVVGMYDLVSGQFFTNAGTGDFIAGPEDTSCTVPVNVSDGTTETTYNINLPAPLQGFGNYKDSIESDGTLTRALGVKVFDGTETFVSEGVLDNCWAYTTKLESDTTFTDRTVWCSHFKHSSTLPSGDSRQGYALIGKVQTGTQGQTAGKYVCFGATNAYPTLANFQAFLASEYAAGHPVTIVWYKKTPTTSSVAVPTIATAKGNNYVDVDTEVKPSNVEVEYVSKEA